MSYCSICGQNHDSTGCPIVIPAAQKIPFKCPVCDGQGTVSKPPHIAGDVNAWTSSDTALYDCPACNGTGIVWGEEGY